VHNAIVEIWLIENALRDSILAEQCVKLKNSRALMWHTQSNWVKAETSF